MNPSDNTLWPVIDGFEFNTRLRQNGTMIDLVLRERLDASRRSGGRRVKWWTCPNDPSATVIPANDAYEENITIEAGGQIDGYIFVAGTDQDGTPIDGSLFSVQVTENCTDTKVFSEVLNMGTAGGGSLMPGEGKWIPLAKPIVAGQRSTYSVEICSLNTLDAINCQLILTGEEPVPEPECKECD